MVGGQAFQRESPPGFLSPVQLPVKLGQLGLGLGPVERHWVVAPARQARDGRAPSAQISCPTYLERIQLVRRLVVLEGGLFMTY